ncbi:MAG: DNA internalization-related competence protein ComEC/Rec2, partial [Gemmatimonadaceae bacterium]
IAVVYGIFAAGLLIGFGGAALWGLAAGTSFLIWALWQRSWETALLAAIGLAAVVWADASRRTARVCLTKIDTQREWLVDLEGDPAGNWWRGRWVAAGCATPVSVQAAHGRVRPGSRVRVRGEFFRQGDRVQLRDADVTELAAPSLLERARTRAGRDIDRLYPKHRALVRALLIAEQRDIERPVRDAFADSGLVHMLSVSGLHVAIIFAAIELLFAVVRLPTRIVAAGALGLTAAYVAMIGAPAPAVRAAVMLGGGAIARAMQRPTSAWAIVALGGLIPLAEPETVRDLGYQLSMAGIVGLVASGSAAQRWMPARLTGWRRSLAANTLTTTLACVATMPIAAYAFGRTSMIAPASNIVMSPIVTLLQPALFLSLAVAPFEHVARLLADGASVLLDVFSLGATWFARVPHATLEMGFTPIGGAALTAASVAVIVAALSRYPGRALLTALGASAIMAWRPLVPVMRTVELHMLDVGQGDALALRASDGSWVIFDAGDSWRSGDAGERVVLPYLKRRGGDVRAIVLSHAHDDHVGGVATVLKRARPQWFIDGGYVTTSGSYKAALEAARRWGVRWWRIHPGDSLVVPGAVIRLLAPDSAWAVALGDPNEASVVARVEVGAWRALLTGDAEAGEEQWMVNRYGSALRADVLKAGHHGSETSSTPPLLDAVQPKVALISVGEGNIYGHPSSDVVRSLERRRSQVLRTDRDGHVVVRFETDRLTVEANGERWRYLRTPGAR